MKKRRILQFTIAATKGGRTQYILNNWKNINKKEFQFDFVTFSSYLDFAEELKKQGCKIFYLSCYPEQNKELFHEEFGKILENGYDTIHIHTSYWVGTMVEEKAREYNIKQIIIHSHSTGLSKVSTKKEYISGLKKHYEIRDCLNEDIATDFLACSDKAADWIFGNSIPKNRIKILHNAIDAKRFTFSEGRRKEIRNRLDIAGNFVLGHIGRMVYAKNHEFLVDLLSYVYPKIPEVVLVLVGDGELREKIEQQVKETDLQNKVLFLGKRDDVEDILQAIDVFLLPSRFEGLPISAIEAQATGLPCILSDLVTEEVKITALVNHEPLIISRWVERIMSIYAQGTVERKSMHAEVERAGFDMKDYVQELEQIYSRVL